MLHYMDCNAAFVNSTDIMESVMPDGLHPNHVGMALLAQVRQLCSSHNTVHDPKRLDVTLGTCMSSLIGWQ